MVSKGARSPAGSAAAKKEPPSATHGSLVVCEHRRTHETTVRCSLFALKSLTPSHTKAPRGPPFRQIASENVVGVITSHRPPSDIARKRRNRAKAPPPAPRPRTPHSARDVSQKRARGAGAVKLSPASPRPLCLVYDALTEPGPLAPHQTNKLTTPAHGGRRTSPACGSCRRPL